MSDPLQQVDFAELAGVSRANINNLVKTGTLEADEEGLLDPQSPKNELYLRKSSDRKKNSKDQTRKNEPGYTAPADSLSAATLRHKIGQAEKIEIENAKKRGELISFALVEKFFNEFVIIDTKQLANVAARSAPNIISICEISDSYQPQIIAEIKGEIYKIIETKKALLAEFLQANANNPQ